jgi:hypothetical protein
VPSCFGRKAITLAALTINVGEGVFAFAVAVVLAIAGFAFVRPAVDLERSG